MRSNWFSTEGDRAVAIPLGRALVCFLLVLPWISPVAGGPSPAVEPWLVSVLVLAVAMLLSVPECFPRFTDVRLAWILAALFSAVFGMVQYAGLSESFAPWVNSAPSGLAYGNLRQRNQFAVLMVIGTAAVLAQRPAGRSTVLQATFLILLAAGNAISSSRIGALGLLVVCAAAVAGAREQRIARVKLCVVAVVAFFVVASTAPAALHALTGVHAQSLFARVSGDAGCSSRLVLWANVLALIDMKPWTGWGWGELDYAHYMTPYGGERFCDILDHAHNLPLHLAVELGIPVAILACALLLGFVIRRKPWAETDADRRLAWTVLGIVLLHSMVEHPLWYGPFMLAAVLCVVTLWPLTATPAADVSRPAARVGMLRAGVAVALVSAAAFVWWDYWRVSQIYLPPDRRGASYRDDTLSQVADTVLFRDQVRFAQLTTTPLSRDNAARMATLASDMLHYSPEPRVIEILIEALVMQGRDEEAADQLVRFQAAFPDRYRAWRERGALPPMGAGQG